MSTFVDVVTTLGAYTLLMERYPDQRVFTFLLFRARCPLLIPFEATDTLSPPFKQFVEERIEKGFGVFTYPEVIARYKNPFITAQDRKLVLVSDYLRPGDKKICTKLQ